MRTGQLVLQTDWPKHFEMPTGHPWRAMLPSGMHCERCHALVTVEPANVGMAGPADGFRSLFDPEALLDLLSVHVIFACRFATPAGSEEKGEGK